MIWALSIAVFDRQKAMQGAVCPCLWPQPRAQGESTEAWLYSQWSNSELVAEGMGQWGDDSWKLAGFHEGKAGLSNPPEC